MDNCNEIKCSVLGVLSVPNNKIHPLLGVLPHCATMLALHLILVRLSPEAFAISRSQAVSTSAFDRPSASQTCENGIESVPIFTVHAASVLRSLR